jgi:thiol-disulfide isomerase/thioredoxin
MAADKPRAQSVDDLRSHAERGHEVAEQSAHWPLLVLVLIAAIVLLAIQLRRPRAIGPLVGLDLPRLEVAGWLNTDGPISTDELRGAVVLVDFWTTTCGPCVREMPDLAQLHEQYGESGLKVVGLTPESNETGNITEFVEQMPGLDWPIAYGAGFTFHLMDIAATPTYILYDRSGSSVWAGHSLRGAEDAIVAALAK